MRDHTEWRVWVQNLFTGIVVPLDTVSVRARVQLVLAAAVASATLDVANAWIGWASPVLREQYAALNAAVAQRWGYTPPSETSFSALGVFAASLFGNSVGAIFVWGMASVVVLITFRQHVAIGRVLPASILPLPLASVVALATTLVHLVMGTIQWSPSVGAFFDPNTADISLFTIASKLDIGSVVYAFAMVRLLLPHHQWHAIVMGAVVGFIVRSIIVAGGILLVARAAL